MIAVYEWAKEYGITTAETYELVRISDAIIRQEMAKVISVFAENLLHKTPDIENVACTQFSDLSAANADLQPYVVESCQLGLMGMQGDGVGVQESFFPH
jgi:gamma-glutamyl:cysteine ligase YbdK (ATP-grasp superfamily)